MLIRQEGETYVISNESPSEIAVFPGEGGTFVVEQDVGVAGVRQSYFTSEQLREIGELFLALAKIPS